MCQWDYEGSTSCFLLPFFTKEPGFLNSLMAESDTGQKMYVNPLFHGGVRK